MTDKQAIFTFIAIAAFCYIVAVFVMGSFNPFAWPLVARLVLAVFAVAFAAAVIADAS